MALMNSKALAAQGFVKIVERLWEEANSFSSVLLKHSEC